jgi:hypothetical protein
MGYLIVTSILKSRKTRLNRHVVGVAHSEKCIIWNITSENKKGETTWKIRRMQECHIKPGKPGYRTLYSDYAPGWTIRGSYPRTEKKNFSPIREVQNGSEVAPLLPSVLGLLSKLQAAGSWSWPLSSIYCRRQEWVEPYLCFPCMTSWSGQGEIHIFPFVILTMFLKEWKLEDVDWNHPAQGSYKWRDIIINTE